MKAILYIGHGTRSKKGADEAKHFLQSVIEQISVPIQEISFLELTPPFIEEGFETCIERGATEILVVPLFLLAAGHITKDIPQALEPLVLKYPEVRVTVADPFGVQESILDAIVELVSETAAEIFPEDSILIVGRGSSDPIIQENFSAIAKGIGNRLGVYRIHVCYLAAAAPPFREGINQITHEARGRVIVIPYLLFGGLLLNEVNQEVKKRWKQGQNILLTGPLSRHSAIRDIIVERALQKGDVYAAARH